MQNIRSSKIKLDYIYKQNCDKRVKNNFIPIIIWSFQMLFKLARQTIRLTAFDVFLYYEIPHRYNNLHYREVSVGGGDVVGVVGDGGTVGVVHQGGVPGTRRSNNSKEQLKTKW